MQRHDDRHNNACSCGQWLQCVRRLHCSREHICGQQCTPVQRPLALNLKSCLTHAHGCAPSNTRHTMVVRRCIGQCDVSAQPNVNGGTILMGGACVRKTRPDKTTHASHPTHYIIHQSLAKVVTITFCALIVRVGMSLSLPHKLLWPCRHGVCVQFRACMHARTRTHTCAPARWRALRADKRVAIHVAVDDITSTGNHVMHSTVVFHRARVVGCTTQQCCATCTSVWHLCALCAGSLATSMSPLGCVCRRC
jgi:hypothetical protein